MLLKKKLFDFLMCGPLPISILISFLQLKVKSLNEKVGTSAILVRTLKEVDSVVESGSHFIIFLRFYVPVSI